MDIDETMSKPYEYDKNDTKRDLIEKLYNDPETGFIGQQKLYKKAKALNRTITMKDVKAYFESRLDLMRFGYQKPQFEEFKITSANPDSWQMDLAFWFKKAILTAININSRLGYAAMLPNKRSKTVIEALKVFTKAHKPAIITTDNGSEFMNKAAQRYFKEQKIEHYNNEAGDHRTMGKIERFNRTIKQRLIKMPERENLTPNVLNKVIRNYNNTDHRSIDMAPNQARGHVMTEEAQHNKRVMDDLSKKLEIGSRVIYRLTRGAFDKEDVRWSKAVYEIVGIDGYKVQIRSKNNHTLYKQPNDLKIVQAETTEAPVKQGDLFEIEKILGHKRMKDGKIKYHIKWTGFDEKTWEPQDNLRLINKNRMSMPERKYFKALARTRKAKQ